MSCCRILILECSFVCFSVGLVVKAIKYWIFNLSHSESLCVPAAQTDYYLTCVAGLLWFNTQHSVIEQQLINTGWRGESGRSNAQNYYYCLSLKQTTNDFKAVSPDKQPAFFHPEMTLTDGWHFQLEAASLQKTGDLSLDVTWYWSESEEEARYVYITTGRAMRESGRGSWAIDCWRLEACGDKEESSSLITQRPCIRGVKFAYDPRSCPQHVFFELEWGREAERQRMHWDFSQWRLVAASYRLKHGGGPCVTAWSDFWWKFDVLTKKEGPASHHKQPEDEKKKRRLPDVWQPLTMIHSILKSAAAHGCARLGPYFSLTSHWRQTRNTLKHCKGKVEKQDWCTRGNCYSFAFKNGYAQEKTHCEVMQIKPELWR